MNRRRSLSLRDSRRRARSRQCSVSGPLYTLCMNWLLKNFLRGLIIVVPIAVTVYILYQSFISLDRLLTLPAPGLGLLILLAATVLIGALAGNFAGRNVF